MRRGEPETAAKAIIAATTDLSKASEADRKLGAAALIDTIELIEVTFQNSMIWIWISELVVRREPTPLKLDQKARHRLVVGTRQPSLPGL